MGIHGLKVMRIAGFAWFLSGFVGAGYRAFTGCPQRPGAGPAGLRGLLKSPPRLAGQAPSALRATRFNPARGRPALNLPIKKWAPDCSDAHENEFRTLLIL